MKARAPGKLVLSGAYAVLEGAPALVAAVDRWAEADTSREPPFVTREVEAALTREAPGATAPWFDASPLRHAGTKLGLGSSAAILVASLAARALDAGCPADDASLAARVLAPALAAHRAAQGGGSGVDVLASAVGGVVRCRRDGETLAHAPWSLPEGVRMATWASGVEASTAEMLARVRRLRELDAPTFARRMGALAEAATATADARDARGFLDALGAQALALSALGAAADAPIVTDAMSALDGAARAAGAVVLPSGAGGGDMVLVAFVGDPPADVARLAAVHGFLEVPLALGARGVHALA